MHRRAFLRGVAGSVALSTVTTARGHPGPYSPLGSVAITNAREAVPDPNGEVAYVAADSGFATVDVQVPSDPQILAERRELLADRETGPLRQLQDLKVEGDRLVVAGPADPKQGDVLQGFLLYDVSDPANPERLAFYETQYPIHNCFLRDGIVYLTGNDRAANPLVLVDVSDDDPEEVGRWSLLDRNEQWGEVSPQLRNLHDVWTQNDRAYLSLWDAGTYVLDVSDPTSPTFVSRIGGRPIEELRSISSDEVRTALFRLPGNDHYAMTSDDGTLLGINKEAWAVEGSGGPGGVELWDLSEETNPQRLTTIDAPKSPDPTIGGTWTTSHNFDIVGDRLFTSWYQGGVKIHDISDPAAPEELAWWRDPDETSFWTAKRATDRFFVASSMGRRSNGKGGLYTFPIHPGQQKDPPALTTAANGTGGNSTGRNTTNGGASTTDTTTAEATPTPTEEAALSAEETTTDAESATGSTPGFGVPAAVAALLAGGAWKRFRD